MISWKHLFRDYILERGYDYYQSGDVTELEKDREEISAVVSGTEDYDVTIYLIGDEIDDMYCSCPYAQDGNHCKHMAAVLYAYEHADYMEESADIEVLVKSADEAVVRNLLISVLRNDKRLAAQFRHVLSNSNDFDILYYKNQAEAIINRYAGRNGYINYRDARDFYEEISGLFYGDADYMIESERYDDALELSLSLLAILCDLDMDDSDGWMGALAYKCEEIWQDIIDGCDADGEKRFFKRLSEAAQKSCGSFAEDYFADFIMSNFCENEFLEGKLAYVNKMIDFYSKSDKSYHSYAASRWIAVKLELMKSCDDDKIEAFCRENWEVSDARQYFINKCIDEERYDEAIKALKESLEMDKDLPGLVRGYLETLKELYKQIGNYDNYLYILWKIVLETRLSDLADYRELKAQYAEDAWEKERERVFDSIDSVYTKSKLFCEECLYDRLLTCAVNFYGLGIVRDYKEILANLFPEEVLNKYTIEVQQMAECTSDRNTYRSIVSVLKEMRRLPQGKMRVDEIAAEWREKYRRRTAMMEELNKL